MLNQDGDSSEEDEDIISTAIPVASSSSFIAVKQQQQQQQQQKKFLLPQPDDEDDEEDEDAPLPSSMQLVPTESAEHIESEECTEAVHALEADCWDINSWILFIDEVEAGRGGKISIPDAHNRFLDKFPRAAKQWKALAEFYTRQQEYILAEEVYNRCLGKCRNVDLWLSYVQMIRQKFPLEANQRVVESAYEKAVDNIGMSLISNPLWRSYIDFIREWPDSDAGRKLGALRKVYQRTVCIPLEDGDIFWKEYELLEKTAGEYFMLFWYHYYTIILRCFKYIF